MDAPKITPAWFHALSKIMGITKSCADCKQCSRVVTMTSENFAATTSIPFATSVRPLAALAMGAFLRIIRSGKATFWLDPYPIRTVLILRTDLVSRRIDHPSIFLKSLRSQALANLSAANLEDVIIDSSDATQSRPFLRNRGAMDDKRLPRYRNAESMEEFSY